MPEGDTLARTAATLHRWLAGRRVTAADSTVAGFPAGRLVGLGVDAVEARGKHLLVRLDSGQVLHTHMRMTGSWHVYRRGERWRRPRSQARLVLECGERLAVCFNAPVVELLQPRAETVHPALARLGPDVLADPPDLAEMRRRARRRPPDLALGELLLDQGVASGIGNIWRCEALFAEGHDPWTPQSALADDRLEALYATAGRLMRAGLPGPLEAVAPGAVAPRTSRAAAGPPSPPAGRVPPRAVYGRAGRPCRRCGTLIAARRQGEAARTVYWCPRCQPPRS